LFPADSIVPRRARWRHKESGSVLMLKAHTRFIKRYDSKWSSTARVRHRRRITSTPPSTWN